MSSVPESWRTRIAKWIVTWLPIVVSGIGLYVAFDSSCIARRALVDANRPQIVIDVPKGEISNRYVAVEQLSDDGCVLAYSCNLKNSGNATARDISIRLESTLAQLLDSAYVLSLVPTAPKVIGAGMWARINVHVPLDRIPPEKRQALASQLDTTPLDVEFVVSYTHEWDPRTKYTSSGKYRLWPERVEQISSDIKKTEK